MDNNIKHQAELKFDTNGPFEVKGNFIIKDCNGIIIPTENVVYLCRCGKSKNKPFCDDSHKF
jgi:CDGSH iron-sulfur domain-containing protein 3